MITYQLCIRFFLILLLPLKCAKLTCHTSSKKINSLFSTLPWANLDLLKNVDHWTAPTKISFYEAQRNMNVLFFCCQRAYMSALRVGFGMGKDDSGVILLPSRKSLLQKMPCLKYRRLHVRNSTQKMPNATRGETFKQEIFLFSSIKIHEEKHEKLQFSIWYITAPSSLLLLLNTFSLPDEPNFPSQNTKLTRIRNKRNRTKPQKTSQ